jgi:hypothetical protein
MQHHGIVKTESAEDMKKAFLLFFITFIISGCETIPFQETSLVSLETRDPWSVVEHFKENVPESFQLLTTVVFGYNGRTFSCIGTIEIDSKNRMFKVAGLNPMGVKLFEISGNNLGVTTHYAIAAITQYGDVGAAIGKDIRRIYFDLLPSQNAPVWKRKYKLIYRQSYDQGYLEFIFAGVDGDLIEKNYYENHQPIWCVSYYEYREQKGKRLPQGIIYVNYQYGYRLTVRQKGQTY